MHVIRGPQRHVKRTRSASQLRRQKAFQWCARVWRENATPSVIEQWQNFAVPPETAYNAFLRINLVLRYNNIKIKFPPLPPE